LDWTPGKRKLHITSLTALPSELVEGELVDDLVAHPDGAAGELHARAIAPLQRAMTSILADFGVWLGGDGLIRGDAALQVLEPPSHATPLRMCATIASMRSAIADALSAEDQARFVALSPAQRANLQLRLGREATRAYAALHGLSFGEARDRLDALGRIGRRPCAWQR
jgi:hypothetical protein